MSTAVLAVYRGVTSNLLSNIKVTVWIKKSHVQMIKEILLRLNNFSIPEKW